MNEKNYQEKGKFPYLPGSNPLLTTRELAAFLGVSVATFCRWRRDTPEKLPPVWKPDRRRPRYRRVDVEAWLNTPQGEGGRA